MLSVWRSEDCVTESGLQLYQLSNKARTATKVFPESSRILRSRTASYSIGETITFWVRNSLTAKCRVFKKYRIFKASGFFKVSDQLTHFMPLVSFYTN